MSRPVKEMMVDHYKERFADVDNALVVDIRGIAANDNNELRLGLQKQNIRITVVKNTLARRALEGTALSAIAPALDGPAALAYGAESVVEVARALVDWAKKIDNLDLRGACLDGRFFEGAEGVKKLSSFPTREEAQAEVVQLVLSPAKNVVGCVASPGSKIAGVIKALQEKLENGEEITKVA